jgi:predicted phage terminase large subunit-like protein
MAALQYVDVPGYAALLLRRTWPDLSQPGALMDRATKWLRGTDAVSTAGGRIWRFPSGARLVFGYAQHPGDEEQFASAEFQYIGIDELSRGWLKRSYEFLFSRLRKPVDADDAPSAFDGTTLAQVPLRMRSASNPGGSGHGWVKETFVDPETRSPSAVFVPARLADNPSLDPVEYTATLERMTSSPVERDRLLLGDWEIVDEGNLFHRHWFGTIDPEGVPIGCHWCRYWDLAATNPKRPGAEGDWTAGALVGLSPQGQWFIADVRRMRGTPLDTERFIAATLEEDLNIGGWIPTASAGALATRMEQEGGAGGINTVDHYRRGVFVGVDFDGDKPRGDKTERARPLSTAAEGGNVVIVRGWPTKDFLDEAELFPWSDHDDQIDAAAGAVNVLTTLSRAYRSHRTRTTAVAHRRLR